MKKVVLILITLLILTTPGFAEEVMNPDQRNSFSDINLNLEGGAFLSFENYRVYKGYPVDENSSRLGFMFSFSDLIISSIYSEGKKAKDVESFIGWSYHENAIFRIGISNFQVNYEEDASNDEAQDRREAVLLTGYEGDYFRIILDYHFNMTNQDEVGDYYSLLTALTLYTGKLDIDLSYEISFMESPQRENTAHHNDVRLNLSWPLEDKSLQVNIGKIGFDSDDSKSRAGEDYLDGYSYASLQLVFSF